MKCVGEGEIEIDDEGVKGSRMKKMRIKTIKKERKDGDRRREGKSNKEDERKEEEGKKKKEG